MDTRGPMPDAKTLRKMKPGDLHLHAIQAAGIHPTLEKGQEFYLEQVRALTAEQAGLFAAFWCHAEVCNGGFYQFFGNSTGIVGPEAVTGFTTLGLEPAARIVEEAMGMLGARFPRDWKWRSAVLKKIHKPEDLRAERSPFEHQDNAFYEVAGMRQFPKVADEFVRRHIERFYR